jgi:hypothetical protein
MADEALKQATAGYAPIYKKNILNGRGVVRFSRTAHDGSAGKYLEMHTSSSSGTRGFAVNPFTANSNSYTILMVARTRQDNAGVCVCV